MSAARQLDLPRRGKALLLGREIFFSSFASPFVILLPLGEVRDKGARRIYPHPYPLLRERVEYGTSLNVNRQVIH
jgi:hypothetical protein